MIHKNTNEIIESMITNFTGAQGTITSADIKPGTMIRGLMEAFALEIDDLYSYGDDIQTNSSVADAAGYNLDAIGARIGCFRISGESDADYRADIYNYLADKRTCSESAISKVVREIAGIDSFTIKNLAFGAGTFAVYIRPKTGADRSVLYSSAKAAVAAAAADGIYFEIVFPEEIDVTMDISIICSSLTADIISKVKNSISKYVSNIPSGQNLLLPMISQTVAAEVSAVNSVYIHKITFNNKTCYAQQYALLDNEQLSVSKINIIQ